MKKTTIICVGNRFVNSDASGMKVYDILSKAERNPGIVLVEGGMAGLNLLAVIKDSNRVIFVDTVRGFSEEKGISLLTCDEILKKTKHMIYDHNGGFLYLIKCLPGPSQRRDAGDSADWDL